MGFTQCFFCSPRLILHPHSFQGPGCCSCSVVKTTAHSGSACESICLSACACLSIFICLILFRNTQVLCRHRAIFCSSLAAASAWLITERLHLTDKLVNLEAYADAYINRIYELLFFHKLQMLSHRAFFSMTLLLSNQRLIMSVAGVCSTTLSQQRARSPQRHSYASYPIGLISSLKEYKAQPPHQAHPPTPTHFWSVADSLFTQCRPSTLLIHQFVYLHFQLIASIMRGDSESRPSFVCEP